MHEQYLVSPQYFWITFEPSVIHWVLICYGIVVHSPNNCFWTVFHSLNMDWYLFHHIILSSLSFTAWILHRLKFTELFEFYYTVFGFTIVSLQKHCLILRITNHSEPSIWFTCCPNLFFSTFSWNPFFQVYIQGIHSLPLCTSVSSTPLIYTTSQNIRKQEQYP